MKALKSQGSDSLQKQNNVHVNMQSCILKSPVSPVGPAGIQRGATESCALDVGLPGLQGWAGLGETGRKLQASRGSGQPQRLWEGGRTHFGGDTEKRNSVHGWEELSQSRDQPLSAQRGRSPADSGPGRAPRARLTTQMHPTRLHPGTRAEQGAWATRMKMFSFIIIKND